MTTTLSAACRPPQPARWPAAALLKYQRWGYVPGPLLAAGLVLPIIAWRRSARRQWPRLRWAMGTFAVTGTLLLIVPVATSGVDFRYLLPALPLLLPAAVIATELLIRRGETSSGPRRPPPVTQKLSYPGQLPA